MTVTWAEQTRRFTLLSGWHPICLSGAPAPWPYYFPDTEPNPDSEVELDSALPSRTPATAMCMTRVWLGQVPRAQDQQRHSSPTRGPPR